MNQARFGLQLYSVRNELNADFEATLAEVANMGYRFVELAGLHGYTPEYVSATLSKYNLQAISMHCDVLTQNGLNQSLYAADIFGCNYLVCPWVDPVTFSSEERVLQFAKQLNAANQIVMAAGKTLCYHNHQFEFQLLNGVTAFDHFVSELDSSIQLQIDLYNAACAGVDPLSILCKERLLMLHFKDGAIHPAEPNMPIGDGVMNYHSIVQAIPSSVEWAFVEIEACNTSKMQAVRDSLNALRLISI